MCVYDCVMLTMLLLSYSYIVSLLNKFEVALSWDARTLLIPSLLPTEEDSSSDRMVTVKVS